MNTRLGKSFGLAFVVAVGILAVMFALGTFNAPKAGADVGAVGADHGVTTNPANPSPGSAVGLTLEFELTGTISRFDEVTITLEDFDIPSDLGERAISVRQGTNGGPPDTVAVNGDTITLELGNISGETFGLTAGDATIVIKKSGGVTAPTLPGTYDITISHDDQAEAVKLGEVVISSDLSVDPVKGGGGTEVTVTGKAFASGTGTLYSEPLIEPDSNEDGNVDQIVFDITVGTQGQDADTNDFPTASSTGDYTLDVDGDGEGANYELRTYTVPAVGRCGWGGRRGGDECVRSGAAGI